DREGRARMVNVADKPDSTRVARAAGSIRLLPGTVDLIRKNEMKKGDVLTVAEIAGVQAAKKTSELIPLCHNIVLNKVAVTATLDESGVNVECIAESFGKTGVEMEALTGVSVALLTVYDMCKAVDKEMLINNVRLTEKIKK
ncbi:MAG TPA: cyclic pyranopterin monophosphate synthase MoaC, partial [Bacteroidetes bacterium]|nr:cyclic pyranopterin monophosphate synthase MoaC [Bacteroidota bacterium]